MGGGEMERRILRRAISIFAVFIILFSGVSLASAQELTGAGTLAYNGISEITDYVDLSGTITNGTVTFTGKGSKVVGTFDNSGGGSWEYVNTFTFSSSANEYGVYKIVISDSTWKLYNFQGTLEGSLSDPEFWSNVKSDGLDIRVSNQDTSTPVQRYFYIESWDFANRNAVIKVRIEPGDSEINVVYGNPSASESSYHDIRGAYEAYDDFEDGTLDPHWSVIIGTWDESGGVLSPQGSGSPIHVGIYWASCTVQDWTLEVKIKMDTPGDDETAGVGLFNLDSSNSITNQISFTMCGGGVYQHGYHLHFNNQGEDVEVGTWSGDTNWHTIKMVKRGTSVEVFFDGVSKGAFSVNDLTYPCYVGLKAHAYKNSLNSHFDDLKVYIEADPVDVSSTSHGTSAVLNPRVIFNGNTIQYNGVLTSGESTSFDIPDSYFVQGTNEIQITSDNLGKMDVQITFDYSESLSFTVDDHETYLFKNGSFSVPEGVTSTLTVYVPKRTSDYQLTVLLDGSPASYTKQDLSDSVKITISGISSGNHELSVKIQYLLFDIYFYNEVDLSSISVNAEIFDENLNSLASYSSKSNIKIYGSEKFGYGSYFMEVSGSSIYTRKVTLYTNELAKTVKVLALPNTETAVSVNFQLNDVYNFYSGNAIIRVSKFMNSEFYEVVSDKIDIEGKINAILMFNEKYYISVIDPATWTEQTIGEFIASESGTKVINVGSVEFNVTTVFDYIEYSIYETDSAIVVHYKDSSGKTSEINVIITDEENNVLFSETSYQQSYDLVREKDANVTVYVVQLRAITDYGVIEVSKVFGKRTGIGSEIIQLLPGEELTGYSKNFLAVLISFGTLIFLAGLFSKLHARMGAIVVSLFAGLFWLLGFLPISGTVIALIIVLAILGKYEEGSRK